MTISGRCSGEDCAFCKAQKSIHVGAKAPQAHASIAGRAPHDKFRHDIGERRIVVVKAFESHKSADERACFAGFDAGCEEE
jgi:hypothetical protein